MTKKTTTKEKSPAPATSTTKTRKKASKPTVAKATPAPVSLTQGPAATPVSPVAAIKPTHTAPTIVEPARAAVKAVAPAHVQTKIVVRIDVGFGNVLYIRGDGPGLSWNEGVPMECVAPDQWEHTLGESARPVSFKVLVNDQLWATGADSVVASGSTVTITPEFA